MAAERIVEKLHADKQVLPMKVYFYFFQELTRSKQYNIYEKVIKHYEQIKALQITPSTDIFNTIIMCFSKRGMTDKVHEWVEKMKECGVEPNTTTLNTVLMCYMQQGDLANMQKIFSELTQLSIPANEITFRYMIEACGKKKDMDAAATYLELMKTSGVKPSPLTLRRLNCVWEQLRNGGIIKNEPEEK